MANAASGWVKWMSLNSRPCHAAILSADVAGCSRLMGEDEEEPEVEVREPRDGER